MESTHTDDLMLRTVPWFLRLIAGLIGFFVFLYLATGVVRHAWAPGPMLLVLPFFVWLYFWYWAMTIEVRDGVLTYKTIISRRAIRLSDIEMAWVEARPGYRAETKRMLVIQPKECTGMRPFAIFTNRFEYRQLKKLYTAVNLTHRHHGGTRGRRGAEH